MPAPVDSRNHKRLQAIHDALDAGYLRERRKERTRQYIGASTIGKPCDAFLELCLRGFPDDPHNPKQLRIFRLGHSVEALVVDDLKSRADFLVWEKDPTTNYQFKYTLFGGHVACHIDGLCSFEDGSDEIMALEIKSMKGTEWNKLEKYGVKKSHKYYYDQMQLVMHMANLKNCLFVSYNKNTSEYHFEIVGFDEVELNYLLARVDRVFDGNARRISDDRTNFSCRFCSKNSACWDQGELEQRFMDITHSNFIEKTCATCTHSKPVKDGTFLCRMTGQIAVNPCPSWEMHRVTPADTTRKRKTKEPTEEPMTDSVTLDSDRNESVSEQEKNDAERVGGKYDFP